MDWQSLKILLKAPRKKYIKKLLEYAVTICHCQRAIPQHAVTPIVQQYPQDLELTAQQAHKLMNALVSLIKQCQQMDFDQSKMKNLLVPQVEEQMSDILVDLILKLQEDIQAHSNSLVSQADRLLSFDWQLDMEVATDKGKTNTPLVQLQFSTSRNSGVENTRISLRGPEFEVFFLNLQKIKEQLSQLVVERQE